MKTALVVSGGGSKGAFAVGAVKQLMETWPGLSFDILVGTSTGSLVVPFVALDRIDLLEDLYTSVRTEDIIITHNLVNRVKEHSIFDANPLWNLITQHLPEDSCNQLLQSDKHIAFNTVCLQTGALTVFANEKNPTPTKNFEKRELLTALHMQKAVMASACQPVFMPPVKVNKSVPGAANPEYQYVDGGVRQYAGIEMAIEAGATTVFTILLSSGQEDPIEKEFKDIFTILQQTVDIFIEDVSKSDLIIPNQYNESLEYIDAVKRKMKREGVSAEDIEKYFTIRGRESPYEDKVPIKLYTIRPSGPLGGGPGGLVFDPKEMKQMMAKGKSSAGEFIASLPPGDIHWA